MMMGAEKALISPRGSVAKAQGLLMLLQDALLPEPACSPGESKESAILGLAPTIEQIAQSIARRSNDPVEELIQVGYVGALKAWDKFDTSKGDEFKPYATFYILGEMRRFLREQSQLIKAPRAVQELYYRVNDMVDRLHQQLGRLPNDAELLKALAVAPQHLEQAKQYEARKTVMSLENYCLTTTAEAAEDLGDKVPPVYLEQLMDVPLEELLETTETRMMVETALAKLESKHQTVLMLRYYEQWSQSRIAQEVGISQMQVSRRLQQGLTQLKAHVSPDQPATASRPLAKGVARFKNQQRLSGRSYRR
jgi:RNA polymerase sigma-B factor